MHLFSLLHFSSAEAKGVLVPNSSTAIFVICAETTRNCGKYQHFFNPVQLGLGRLCVVQNSTKYYSTTGTRFGVS